MTRNLYLLTIYSRTLISQSIHQAAVGLIISSVFQLGTNAYISSPFRVTSICIGIACFGFSEVLRVPAPFVVFGGGAMGVIAWAIPMQ